MYTDEGSDSRDPQVFCEVVVRVVSGFSGLVPQKEFTLDINCFKHLVSLRTGSTTKTSLCQKSGSLLLLL